MTPFKSGIDAYAIPPTVIATTTAKAAARPRLLGIRFVLSPLHSCSLVTEATSSRAAAHLSTKSGAQDAVRAVHAEHAPPVAHKNSGQMPEGGHPEGPARSCELE